MGSLLYSTGNNKMAENNNEFKDSFLTTKEKSHMQTSYTQIKEHLKCEELVPCLHEKSIISQTEKQNIEAKETNDKKVSQNSYLTLL